jgi:hypothetical protein
MKPQDFDHPIVFLGTISIGVIGVIAILSWLFASLGWSGPLGLVKGGVS